MAEERRRIEELEKLLAESKKREEESKKREEEIRKREEESNKRQKRYESMFGSVDSNFIAAIVTNRRNRRPNCGKFNQNPWRKYWAQKAQTISGLEFTPLGIKRKKPKNETFCICLG
jgi:hypothetical protein